MANEKIIVQLANPERYFTKCYHDFMDCNLLNGEEKIVFLALKRFLDVKSEQGKVFPTIETIQDMTGWGNQKVEKYIKSLVKKGIVKKIRQGLSKPNIYILSDYPTMWTCDNIEDVAAVVDNKGVKPLTPEQHIAELEHMGYKVEIIEKELDAEPTKAQNQALKVNNFKQFDSTTNYVENQDLERYTITQIKQLFDYDAMFQKQPDQQQDIDTVMSILHTAMNTAKSTIRIAGQDKPTMVVIGKLMKLDKNSILYAIEKYQEKTEKIKNPTAYMLTILYNAPEQYHLDMKNKISNETAKVDCGPEDKNNSDKDQNNKSSFHNFKQRTYDYDALEQELLNR